MQETPFINLITENERTIVVVTLVGQCNSSASRLNVVLQTVWHNVLGAKPGHYSCSQQDLQYTESTHGLFNLVFFKVGKSKMCGLAPPA